MGYFTTMIGKRGAIELSITTIVVVVIGITLLVLGLSFVYNIFGDLGEQQKKLGEFTDEQIRDIFAASDQYLNLPTTDFSVEVGKPFNLDMVIKNQAQNQDQCSFKLNLITSPVGGVDPANWFTTTPYAIGTSFNAKKATPVKIRSSIKPTRANSQLGDYALTMQLISTSSCDIYSANDVVDQQPISIRVV